MYQQVIDFWFTEITPAQWWKKSDAFDQHIKERFSTIHQQAIHCELSSWRETSTGSLAEVIVLDQFSRNMYRDTPQAFAYDGLALALAQEAIRKEQDKALNADQRSFLYMPFMHSESLMIHDQATDLFANLGMPNTVDFEKKHRDIIAQFGRYPHRNTILGRTSTPEEIEFLTQAGSSF